MPNKDIEAKILRKLNEGAQKGRRNIFVKDVNWEKAVVWGEAQVPPVKVSTLIDALLEMFFEEREGKK